MIEITVKEFATLELPVKVHYKGSMKPGIKLLERRVVPEKVKILGYKSQITNIHEVEAVDWVDLSVIEADTVIKIPLKKEDEILKFEDTDKVEVYITVENPRKEKVENPPGS
jgi:YbbR domain-containing protein